MRVARNRGGIADIDFSAAAQRRGDDTDTGRNTGRGPNCRRIRCNDITAIHAAGVCVHQDRAVGPHICPGADINNGRGADIRDHSATDSTRRCRQRRRAAQLTQRGACRGFRTQIIASKDPAATADLNRDPVCRSTGQDVDPATLGLDAIGGPRAACVSRELPGRTPVPVGIPTAALLGALQLTVHGAQHRCRVTITRRRPDGGEAHRRGQRRATHSANNDCRSDLTGTDGAQIDIALRLHPGFIARHDTHRPTEARVIKRRANADPANRDRANGACDINRLIGIEGHGAGRAHRLVCPDFNLGLGLGERHIRRNCTGKTATCARDHNGRGLQICRGIQRC